MITALITAICERLGQVGVTAVQRANAAVVVADERSVGTIFATRVYRDLVVSYRREKTQTAHVWAPKEWSADAVERVGDYVVGMAKASPYRAEPASLPPASQGRVKSS